ncbi:hypothetical protein Tco_1128784, partial [Tanacetum coccineum]
VRTPSNDFKASFFLLLGFYSELRGVDLNGGRCWKGFGYKVMTKGCLEALVLKGGDEGACKLLGRLLGDVIEVVEVLGC